MIEIYFKMKDSLFPKYGQDWFDNKIVETVGMMPDGNKSLLPKTNDDSGSLSDSGIMTNNN